MINEYLVALQCKTFRKFINKASILMFHEWSGFQIEWIDLTKETNSRWEVSVYSCARLLFRSVFWGHFFICHVQSCTDPLTAAWLIHPRVSTCSLSFPEPRWKMKMACADCNKNNPSDIVMATFIYSDPSNYIRCITWLTYVSLTEPVFTLMLFGLFTFCWKHQPGE